MKKLFTSLMLLLTVAVLVFTLTACNNENDDETMAPKDELDYAECEHKEWKLVGSLEATCENAGYNTLKCKSCGRQQTIFTPMVEHEVVWEVEQNAYNDGYKVKFICPLNSEHNAERGIIRTESYIDTGDPYTKLQIIKYEARYKGQVFTHEKTLVVCKGSHQYDVSYEYEQEGEGCRVATSRIFTCINCEYKTRFNNYNSIVHKGNQTLYYNLANYCGCEGTITIKKPCQCGRYKEEVIIEAVVDEKEDISGEVVNHPIHQGHSYEEIDPSEVLPEGMVACKGEVAYKFDCGLCYYDGYVLKYVSGVPYIYGYLIIVYDGTVLCEQMDDEGHIYQGDIWDLEESDEPEEPDEELPKDEYSPEFGRDLTNEEKRAILEYLKELLENDSAELTDEQRAQYEEGVKQLEEELGKEQ